MSVLRKTILLKTYFEVFYVEVTQKSNRKQLFTMREKYRQEFSGNYLEL